MSGAPNRKTQEWIDYINATYGNPLEILAASLRLPIDEVRALVAPPNGPYFYLDEHGHLVRLDPRPHERLNIQALLDRIGVSSADFANLPLNAWISVAGSSVPCVLALHQHPDGICRSAFGIDAAPLRPAPGDEGGRIDQDLLDRDALTANLLEKGFCGFEPFIECLLEISRPQSLRLGEAGAGKPGDGAAELLFHLEIQARRAESGQTPCAPGGDA